MHATMHLYYTIAKYYFTRILLLLLSVADICYSWYVYKCCNFLLVLVSAVSHLVVSICNIILLLLKPNGEKYVLLYFFLLDLFMFFSYLFLDLTLLQFPLCIIFFFYKLLLIYKSCLLVCEIVLSIVNVCVCVCVA